jgi:sulfur dioxygenase
MLLRQLFDKQSSTYTYLIADKQSKEAIIIDSVLEQHERDLKLINELGLKLKYAIDTHIHADHITGMGLLKQNLNCQIAMPFASNINIADFLINDGDNLNFGSYNLKAIHTPGHTECDTCYLVDNLLFSGDTLFIRGTGRTDFQSGSAELMYNSIHNKLFSLPDSTIVLPAHDYNGMTQSTIFEEKNYNPRLLNGKDNFINIMNTLNLAKPKNIESAVPANMKCGVL